MKRSIIALVVLGLCSACHKPKKPKPKAHLEVSNECDQAVIVAFGTTAESDDAIMVELDAGEAIGWELREREHLWSRDDDDADWIVAHDEGDEGDESAVVSVCVTARFAQAQT
jgi:hypothetical protein